MHLEFLEEYILVLCQMQYKHSTKDTYILQGKQVISQHFWAFH